METTALKQLLKSLCKNLHWDYAVFWKIKYQNQVILAWEDGYYDYPKLEKHMGSVTEDVHRDDIDKNISSCYGTNSHNGDSGSYSVGPAVADMSYLQFALGEGTVGRVASSGIHSWLFLENIFTSDVFSTLISECHSEWLIQYALGIKTILLVPVLPFGVLQLGSLQMVAEELSMVAHIKERFSALHSVDAETQSPCTQLTNHHDTGFFEGNHLDVHSYSANNMVEHRVEHNFVTKKECDSADNFFSFPDECELRQAFEPSFQGQKQTNEVLYESCGSIMDTTSSLMCNGDFNEGNIEHLLEAMMANLYDNSDDTSSNNTVNASTASVSGKFVHSARQCSQSESSAIMRDDPAPWVFPKPTVIDRGRKNLTSLSTSNSVVINEQEDKYCDTTQTRKGIKKSNSSRRTKLIANPKQRPRDRQLIQDRIKELRDIVPNGAKCSIDGLLEKTIKHMQYLRRVTDQAEKLKQLVQREDTDSKNFAALENDASSQNGASWAYDIGSELQVCPIVVEDLEHVGHMLIEMLCNDMGLFLEIAQVIRHLELTILKGVIERRSNNSWAHFIVEAPRGFHRMDIFWPLMHLLQRKRNPISSRI